MAHLLSCSPAWRVLGDSQAESGRVAPCGAVAEGMRTNWQTEARNGAPRLGGPWATWRNGVQDGDGRRVACQDEQLLSRWDGLQIKNLGSARDDDQIGNARSFQSCQFRPRWRIDHHQVNALLSSRLEGVLQARRLNVDDHGIGHLPSVPPSARARLRVGIQHDDSLPSAARFHRKRQRETRFARASLLREEGDDLH